MKFFEVSPPEENIRDMGRVASVQIGCLRFTVVNQPKSWSPPYSTNLRVTWVGNRYWRLEVVFVSARYRRVA